MVDDEDVNNDTDDDDDNDDDYDDCFDDDATHLSRASLS